MNDVKTIIFDSIKKLLGAKFKGKNFSEEELASIANDIGHEVGEYMQNTQNKITNSAKEMQHIVQSYPATSIGAAFVAGALFAAIISRR